MPWVMVVVGAIECMPHRKSVRPWRFAFYNFVAFVGFRGERRMQVTSGICVRRMGELRLTPFFWVGAGWTGAGVGMTGCAFCDVHGRVWVFYVWVGAWMVFFFFFLWKFFVFFVLWFL